MGKAVDVTIVGGGMITNDLILPSIYQLRREGAVRRINVCALNNPPLKALADNREMKTAFPGQTFTPFPDFEQKADDNFPDLYKEVLSGMEPRQTVVVAMPDQRHYPVVMEALKNNQHVLCVRPLVLEYKQTEAIKKLAHDKGLFVGVDYHKRFDRRSLIARRDYHRGQFGEFVMGEAKMIEPYFYRSTNFQNWFTVDQTDPFVCVGCHYVDLVYFITGLKPTEVSVSGVTGTFPNGNTGYMWTNGRVRFENGALLSVTDGLGYPDNGAGSNEQLLTMFCDGNGRSGMIKHNDQFRGVCHSLLQDGGTGGKKFNYINPDFYRLVPWEGEGEKPVGYGFESIAAAIHTITRIEGEENAADTTRRRELIEEVDETGMIATPANSFINELVVEAARASITADGDAVSIIYGQTPRIERRHN